MRCRCRSIRDRARPHVVQPDVAATGRLSSTNPNLQNIPIRTELGRRVRRAFIADHRPEYTLFDEPVLRLRRLFADRAAADGAHERRAVPDRRVRAGEDIHRATAALVYGVSQDEVTADMRRVAKTVNFGLLYGMQAYRALARHRSAAAEAQKLHRSVLGEPAEGEARIFDETLAFGRHQRLRRDDRRPAARHRRPDIGERRAPGGGRADGGQHAVAGHRRRHHEDRDDQVDSRLRETKLPAAHDPAGPRRTGAGSRSALRWTMSHAGQGRDGIGLELSVPLVADVSTGQNWNEIGARSTPNASVSRTFESRRADLLELTDGVIAVFTGAEIT